MALGKRKQSEELKLNLSPMIDCTFLLIIYFIVSLQMEPSLDNIIKLPPVRKADKQEDALLQIYVLPAKIDKDGMVKGDSTGLIAFSDKAKMPGTCPACGAALRSSDDAYVPNSMTYEDGTPIADLQKAMAAVYGENAPPPVFHCAKCRGEIGPYVKLEEVPQLLKAKKAEVLELMARSRNARLRKNGQAELDSLGRKALEDSIALMIKADDKTFYGRVLQVVNMAKDTTAKIKNFAFVTLAEASEAGQQVAGKKRELMGSDE